MRSLQRWFESAFEAFLFNSRLIVILAVLGSLTSSVLMFVRGAILIYFSAKNFLHHFGDVHEGGDELSISLISSVDCFLFATVLLIFAMGIYELFISKIDPASRTAESRPNWLQISSLDDLKGAVGKVILMILIVRLFETAVKMKYEHPLHLLYLGCAVLFVAAALYLQHLGHKNDKHGDHAEEYKSERHDDEDSAKEHAHAPVQGPSHAPVLAHGVHAAHAAQQPHPAHHPPTPAIIAAAPAFAPSTAPAMQAAAPYAQPGPGHHAYGPPSGQVASMPQPIPQQPWNAPPPRGSQGY